MRIYNILLGLISAWFFCVISSTYNYLRMKRLKIMYLSYRHGLQKKLPDSFEAETRYLLEQVSSAKNRQSAFRNLSICNFPMYLQESVALKYFDYAISELCLKAKKTLNPVSLLKSILNYNIDSPHDSGKVLAKLVGMLLKNIGIVLSFLAGAFGEQAVKLLLKVLGSDS